MKTKITALTCLLCTFLLLSACSRESNGVPESDIPSTYSKEISGVPESVLLRDAGDLTQNCTNYKIEHNVDTAAHIDDLQLITIYKGRYGTKTLTTPYSYIYDKSTDIWTLMDTGSADAVYSVNKQAYIDSSPWTGRKSMNGWWYQYSITIHKIDESSVTVSYHIDFEQDNEWLKDIIHDSPTELYLSTFWDIPEFKIALAGEGYKTQYLECRLDIYGLNEG